MNFIPQLSIKNSLFLGLTLLFIGFSSCKTSSVTDQKNVENNKTDLLTTRWDTVKFEPDPFSSLVNLETSYGVLKIELFFGTGEHRENFLKLANKGFYDNLLFHRVIKNFMAQGGDPKSKNAKPSTRLGGGGPGYEVEEEINTEFFHVRGALAAARQPDEVNPEKKSSGSQFYIVHGNRVSEDQLDQIERKYNIAYSPLQRKLYQELGGAPQLDMEYTVFGRVYEGFHIIDSIANVGTNSYDRPLDDLKMVIKIVKE
ncbi:MAG: peptidylprolyl isomerase [Saprospiraceae bacterium]|nr:peptidylprolyl isomerase [Saprospiraceae bacterium]